MILSVIVSCALVYVSRSPCVCMCCVVAARVCNTLGNTIGLALYRFQSKARKSVGFTMSAEDLTASSPGSKDEKKKVGGFF